MDSIDITLKSPMPVVAIDQPYDKVRFWLSISPSTKDGGTVDYSAALRVLPYRVLDGGTVDDAPGVLERTVIIPSVAEAIEGGGVYGQVCGGILQILGQALTNTR